MRSFFSLFCVWRELHKIEELFACHWKILTSICCKTIALWSGYQIIHRILCRELEPQKTLTKTMYLNNCLYLVVILNRKISSVAEMIQMLKWLNDRSTLKYDPFFLMFLYVCCSTNYKSVFPHKIIIRRTQITAIFISEIIQNPLYLNATNVISNCITLDLKL